VYKLRGICICWKENHNVSPLRLFFFSITGRVVKHSVKQLLGHMGCVMLWFL
jgi:hypothetical protein